MIAFVDSFLIFDPYPGFASLEKRRVGAMTPISGGKTI
jgi:hypothetical protein